MPAGGDDAGSEPEPPAEEADDDSTDADSGDVVSRPRPADDRREFCGPDRSSPIALDDRRTVDVCVLTFTVVCTQGPGGVRLAGRVRASQGFFTIERTCPTCSGTGRVISDGPPTVQTRYKLAG